MLLALNTGLKGVECNSGHGCGNEKVRTQTFFRLSRDENHRGRSAVCADYIQRWGKTLFYRPKQRNVKYWLEAGHAVLY